jgi:hypothetical protein
MLLARAAPERRALTDASPPPHTPPPPQAGKKTLKATKKAGNFPQRKFALKA